MKSRKLPIFLLFLAGLPLLVYPFLLIANAMSVAGYQAADVSVFVIIFRSAFLLISTLYPVVFLGSVVSYVVSQRRGNSRWAGRSVWIPYLTLALILVLFLLWLLAEYLFK